jgi:hypothetical protein
MPALSQAKRGCGSALRATTVSYLDIDVLLRSANSVGAGCEVAVK